MKGYANLHNTTLQLLANISNFSDAIQDAI